MRATAWLFLVVALFACSLFAQGERGSFNGLVTDATGAVVPGATVTALHLGTNIETKTTTTDAGFFRLPYLPSGAYTITIGAQGFQTAVRENVTLHVAQTLTLNFELKLGAVTETVNVTAESPLLEASTAEIGRYVTKKEFDTWPIPVSDGHRQIQQFIFTALPGTTGGTFQGSINGGQFYSHEILIEGIPLGRMDLQGGSNNEFSPSAEAVSEFKLQTGTVGAQYTGGQTAVANFGVKSGTNDIHGAAFTYVQNDVLRANSFANNATNRAKPPFKLFNWGYAAGGPVYIPKVYNGKNKTFWFTNLEVTRQRDFTATGLGRLPTVDFKSGDFSRLFNPAFTGNSRSGTIVGTDAEGRPVRFGQIYNPLTARAAGNTMVRDPIVNNIIPQSMWSSVSRSILQQAPITDPLIDRMLNNIPTINTCCPIFDERIYGFKVDHLISSSHRISAYYNHHYRFRNNSPGGRWGHPLNVSPTGVYQNQYTPGRLVRISEDWTISPTMVNRVAVGYNRFGNLNQSTYVDQDWPSKIGLQNVPGTHFPALLFDGQAHLGGGIGAGGRLGSTNAGGGYYGSSILQDDLTIVRGRHNFKAGFEGRRYFLNSRGRGNETGTFRFNPIQTGLPGFADSTGHAFASFLLGAASETNRNVVASFFGYRSTQLGFYFMDDFKVNRKLTLNLGVRWEVIPPFYEVAGRISGFDPGVANPDAAGRLGALAFVDDQGRKSFQDTYWAQLGPRFGFAYAVSDKLVIRGGYGIINTPPILDGFDTPNAFGFNGSISRNSSNTPLRFPQDPVVYLHDRYPDFTGILPNKNPSQANGQSVRYMARDSTRLPYVQNYNLGVQYQVPGNTVVELSYIGNKGTRLKAPGLDNMNQASLQHLALGDRLIEPLSRNPGLVPLPYAGFNGTVAQALRPFPQYTTISQFWPGFGTSHYDSLQVLATRHFTRGLAFMAAYTWSKTIELVDQPGPDGGQPAQDVYNRKLEKSIASFNIPHFFKLTWIYELPIGPGKMLNVPGIAGKIIGGWTFTANHRYRSGDPLGIRTSGLNNALSLGQIRPDVVPGKDVVIYSGEPLQFGTGTRYLNPEAFAQVPKTGNNVPLRIGTAPRYLPNVRGFHRLEEDFGLSKKFSWNENVGFEIRADMINVFNRAGRGNPDTDVTSANFGKFTGPQLGPRSIQVGARFTF